MPDVPVSQFRILSNYDRRYGDTRLFGIKDLALVSFALPHDSLHYAESMIATTYRIDMPEPGHSTADPLNQLRILRTGVDHGFFLFKSAEPMPVYDMQDRLDTSIYLTDQSDGWVGLHILGPGAHRALQRMSMIDTDPTVFPINGIARTMVDHIDTILIRIAPNEWQVLSPLSSAESFTYAVTSALRNTN